MIPAHAMSEGYIVRNVASYLNGEFLYAGTVSTHWSRCFPLGKCWTSVLNAIVSAAKAKEAVRSGICLLNLFDIAVVFGADRSVLQQLRGMGVRRCHTTSLHYASYTGNLDAVSVICEDEYCDACDIFEAVRGGNIDVVRCAFKNKLPAQDTPTVAQIPTWRINMFEKAFLKHCRYLARVNARLDVADKLEEYCRSTRERNISCVDLAIANGRPDIVRVLRGDMMSGC